MVIFARLSGSVIIAKMVPTCFGRGEFNDQGITLI